jgi:hypothetical protein
MKPKKLLRSGLLVVSLLLLPWSGCLADDAAVLWDISRSVPEALYSPVVVQTVLSLLSGQGVPEGWQVTTPSPVPEPLQRVLGKKAPVIAQNDRVLVVRFGTLDRNSGIKNLPFQAQELTLAGATLEELLKPAFPTRSTDAWTNKLLAEASAARYFYDKGGKSWYQLMISDFNEDNKEHLLPDEVSFVDAYRAQQFVSITPPVVLRLRADPRVIMELKHVSSLREPPPPPGGAGAPPKIPEIPSRRLEPISPRNNATQPAGQPVTFSWRWNGAAPPSGGYRLVVSRTDTRQTILTRATQATAFTSPAPLERGRYRWQVYATAGQEIISSTPLPFSVEGGSGPYLLLIPLLAAVGLLAYWLNRRRRKLRLEGK